MLDDAVGNQRLVPEMLVVQVDPESFGIVGCRFVDTLPGILGLVCLRFRPNSGSKSKIPGRILKSFRDPFSSADIASPMFRTTALGAAAPRPPTLSWGAPPPESLRSGRAEGWVRLMWG